MLDRAKLEYSSQIYEYKKGLYKVVLIFLSTKYLYIEDNTWSEGQI